jgi:hypothetical protein
MVLIVPPTKSIENPGIEHSEMPVQKEFEFDTLLTGCEPASDELPPGLFVVSLRTLGRNQFFSEKFLEMPGEGANPLRQFLLS